MQWLSEKNDWITLAHLMVLGIVSVLAVGSATHSDDGSFWGSQASRQLVYLVIGAFVYMVVKKIDYHDWADAWFLIYALGIASLVLLLFVARPIAGARSWFELGPIRLQPSELIKAVLALSVAAFLCDSPGKLNLWRLIKLGMLIGLPAVLIGLQPDMGTMLTLAPLFLAGAWLAGIRPRVLVALGVVAALAAPVLWFGVLEEYQKERVLTVFDPSRDPTGSGYQVIQSRIAVGSGGVTGQGLFSGSQSRLDFLPARETDFVLAVVAEELGFVGVLAVLGVYLSLLMRAIETARKAQDALGTYLAAGIASIWAGQIFINCGMVTGVFPTIGVPLPVLSYGGSAILATAVAFGFVGSVRVGRFVNA